MPSVLKDSCPQLGAAGCNRLIDPSFLAKAGVEKAKRALDGAELQPHFLRDLALGKPSLGKVEHLLFASGDSHHAIPSAAL